MSLREEYQISAPPIQEGKILHFTIKLINKSEIVYEEKDVEKSQKNSGYLIEVECLNPKLGRLTLRCRSRYAEQMLPNSFYDLPVRKPKGWPLPVNGNINCNNPLIINNVYEGIVCGNPVLLPPIPRVFVGLEATSATLT